MRLPPFSVSASCLGITNGLDFCEQSNKLKLVSTKKFSDVVALLSLLPILQRVLRKVSTIFGSMLYMVGMVSF